MRGVVASLTRPWFYGIEAIGELVYILGQTLLRFKYLYANRDLVVKEMMAVGVSTLPLVAVTSLFTGMVAAVQSEYNFRGLVPDVYVGTATCKMVIIELGPILTALVMAGRVGTALAAELGSMKEKEELAAMEALNLDFYRYVAMPRLFAYITMLPSLSIIASFLALIGGWIICVLSLDINTYTYVMGLKTYFISSNLWVAVVKSVFFGACICVLGLYHGVNAGAGAKGVGAATMKTVVSACVGILVLDFLIAVVAFN